MRSLRILAALVVAGLAFARPAQAQDLQIYGFFQGQARYSQETGTAFDETFSASLQQLNLFVANQFTPSWSAFVNTEIRNSFSTENGFGDLRLEEAWVRYNYDARFNVKAGLLTPTFGNLNEVKNRTPLLPYVFRPLAYESTFQSILPIRALVPDQAFLQVYGTLPTGDVRWDYAAFVGNSEDAYRAPRPMGSVIAGTDTTLAKVVGGRVGARWRSLKVGVSGTYDQRKLDNLAVGSNVLPIGLGDVQRTRLGADASFNTGRFFGEAEAIWALYGLEDAQAQRLDFLSNSPVLPVRDETGAPVIGPDGNPVFVANPLEPVLSGTLDASFYHAMAGVNVTEQAFAYAGYNYLEDTSNSAFSSGMDAYMVGAGYRPIDPVVLKLQYIRTAVRENPLSQYEGHNVFAAVSVSF